MGTYKFVWPQFSAANDDNMVVKLRDLLSESTLKDHYKEGLLAANFTSLDDLSKVKALRTSIQYLVETFERLKVDEASGLTVMKLVWKAQIKADAQWKLKAATARTIAELMEAHRCIRLLQASMGHGKTVQGPRPPGLVSARAGSGWRSRGWFS